MCMILHPSTDVFFFFFCLLVGLITCNYITYFHPDDKSATGLLGVNAALIPMGSQLLYTPFTGFLYENHSVFKKKKKSITQIHIMCVHSHM